MVLGDALLGQMQEPVRKHKYKPREYAKDWILSGAKDRKSRLLKSLFLSDGELTDHNWMLHKKYESMQSEIMYESSAIPGRTTVDAGPVTAYTLTGLDLDTTYQISVRAYDFRTNFSNPSPAVFGATQGDVPTMSLGAMLLLLLVFSLGILYRRSAKSSSDVEPECPESVT